MARFSLIFGRSLITKKIALMSLMLAVSACSSDRSTLPSSSADQPQVPANAQAADDAEAIAAQTSHGIKVEVTIKAPVKRMLKEDVVGLPHEKFLIALSNGTTVLVAHDIKYAPAVPLQAGDMVRIHGEYIWNSKGGIIHWTHHSDNPRHEGGWIDFNGKRYE